MADKTDDAPGREQTWSERVEERLDALERKVKGGGKDKGKAADGGKGKAADSGKDKAPDGGKADDGGDGAKGGN